MRTVRTVEALRALLRPERLRERTIGLVPTMGALHAGHLELIAAARRSCDVVVVSLFVNPAQFNEAADLEAYPRDEGRDAQLAAGEGADVLFVPVPEDVYPPGFATTVSVSGLTGLLEGRHRGPAHFDGVATMVAKLLNMVGPDVAFFGQKDAQQALIIRRLVSDLNFPVRVEVCPTIREPDGLALSSRNVHLDPDDRRRAAALHRALHRAGAAVLSGERDAASVRAMALDELRKAGIEPDYIELAEPDTFEPVTSIDRDVLALIAARLGETRLIDNQLLRPPAVAARAKSNGGH